jgi:ferrous iron transport protein A
MSRMANSQAQEKPIPQLESQSHTSRIGTPLTKVMRGQKGKVTEIQGTMELQRRLTELGLTEGAKIHLIHTTGKTFTVKVRDTRLALGFEVAAKILVDIGD